MCNTAWRYLRVLKKSVCTVHTVESVVSLKRTITETEKSLNIRISFSHAENGQRNAETGRNLSKSHRDCFEGLAFS